MDVSVQRCLSLDLLRANLRYVMLIRANTADSGSSVMVAVNVLSHRSRSADVIFNVLEIRSNLKFGKNSWPSPREHY